MRYPFILLFLLFSASSFTVRAQSETKSDSLEQVAPIAQPAPVVDTTVRDSTSLPAFAFEVLVAGEGVQPALGQEIKIHQTVLDSAGNIVLSTRLLKVPVYLTLGQLEAPEFRQRDEAFTQMKVDGVYQFRLARTLLEPAYLANNEDLGEAVNVKVELLEVLDGKPNGAKMVMTLLESEPDAAIQWFHENFGKEDYSWREWNINELGYQLMKTDRLAAALDVFKANAEAHPRSFNAQKSLADVYLALEDKVMAREYFRRALRINPQDQELRDRLEGL